MNIKLIANTAIHHARIVMEQHLIIVQVVITA